MHTQSESENLKGTDDLCDLDVDGMMMLKWILNKFDVKARPGFR